MSRSAIGWYCQQHTDTERFRPELMAAESSSAQFAAVAARFGEWAQEDATFDKNNKSGWGSGNARCDESNQQEPGPALACA